MFQELLTQNLQIALPLLSLFIFSVTFLAAGVRAWRMGSESMTDHIAHLPMDDGSIPSSPISQTSRASGGSHD